MEYHDKNLIILLGPTASGKTAIGIELAKWLGTEIVSADSRQVFRELNIGAAKPSHEQLQIARHHLIGHIPVKEEYNAGKFEKEALTVLNRIFNQKPVALLVGGSGLYIDALCHGLDALLDSDPHIRSSLMEQLKVKGIEHLQEELGHIDPDYYKMVDRSNPNRIIRALEVFRISGKPYSSFRKGIKAVRDFGIIKIGLDVSREELIRRINLRTDRMMQDGLLEEVRSLLPFRSYNALNTVGYKELFDYLDGKCSFQEAVEKIKINTRRYAKRQMTWFRRDKEINWFTPNDLEGMKKLIDNGF